VTLKTLVVQRDPVPDDMSDSDNVGKIGEVVGIKASLPSLSTEVLESNGMRWGLIEAKSFHLKLPQIETLTPKAG
jgi:hypothetical protein